MMLRYSGSVGAGTVITAALILGMQQLISTGAVEPAPGRPIVFMGPVRLPPPPPPPADPKPPPPRPTPIETPPATPVVATDADRVTTGPIRTPGPPRLPGFEGIRGTGFGTGGAWIGGGELMLISSAGPVYPQSALTRDLEGSVLVEFTVMADGRVRDPVVVESSHPLFERAALAAALDFRYQPRVVDGSPVAVPGVRAAIEFEIED